MTMTRFRFGGLLTLTAACLIAGLGSVAFSGDKEEAKKKVSAEEETYSLDKAGQSVQDITMAYSLVDYARRTKSPESLVTAALVLHRNPTTPMTLEVDTDQELQKQPPDESDEPANLLKEARAMRPEDKLLGDTIDRSAEELKDKPRGVIGGPKRWSGWLRHGYKVTGRYNFAYNVRATVGYRIVAHPIDGRYRALLLKVTNQRGTIVELANATLGTLLWFPHPSSGRLHTIEVAYYCPSVPRTAVYVSINVP